MDLACLKKKKKKGNYKLVVTVRAPKASSTRRQHQRKLHKKKKKKKKNKLVVTVHAPKASSTRRDNQRKKLHKKKEVKRGQQQLKLCDFPADLVANIVEGLSTADRIRFGATCKKNLSLVTAKHRPHQYHFRPIDKLPWLASFHCHAPDITTNLSLSFSLFEPLHIQGQPDYATYKIKDPKGEGFGGWGRNKLKASKKGWLLCFWPKQAHGKETGLTCFLLFSPFNKRIIKLPELDHSFVDNWIDLDYSQATFSTDPSSPDCVYFFWSRMKSDQFRISTLDQRSEEWNSTVFDELIDYVSSVVYNEGCFYCLSTIGELAAYDVVHRSWNVLVPFSSRLADMVRSSDAYLVACEGNVILVVLDRKPLEYKVEMNSCGLFEFSSSTRTWVKKTSLGNNALFVGLTSFSVPVMPSSSSENIANRVYFYSRSTSNNPFYYSLKDGRCHQCKDSTYWSSDVEGGIWIEPPCLNSIPYSSDYPSSLFP